MKEIVILLVNLIFSCYSLTKYTWCPLVCAVVGAKKPFVDNPQRTILSPFEVFFALWIGDLFEFYTLNSVALSDHFSQITLFLGHPVSFDLLLGKFK